MIFHIAHRSDWESAIASGEYRVSSRGRTIDDEGFIHASTAEQLSATALRFYADDREPLVVLTLEEERIAASGIELRWEGGAELFPHIYGVILPRWVTEVRDATVVDGGFVVGT
jgi:uncharacterized protein (DUF952 family)